MQIEITHKPYTGRGDKIIVHHGGDAWELPYCWETLVMLYDVERTVRCEIWQLYPHFTLDSSGVTVYNVLR